MTIILVSFLIIGLLGVLLARKCALGEEAGPYVVLLLVGSMVILCVLGIIWSAPYVSDIDYASAVLLYSVVDSFDAPIKARVYVEVVRINKAILTVRARENSDWIGVFYSERIANFKLIGKDLKEITKL